MQLLTSTERKEAGPPESDSYPTSYPHHIIIAIALRLPCSFFTKHLEMASTLHVCYAGFGCSNNVQCGFRVRGLLLGLVESRVMLSVCCLLLLKA